MLFCSITYQKIFLTQAEWALEKQAFTTNDHMVQHWQDKIYLGAGKQVHFTKKLALQVLFMINVLPDSAPMQQPRWQIRVGLLKNTY